MLLLLYFMGHRDHCARDFHKGKNTSRKGSLEAILVGAHSLRSGPPCTWLTCQNILYVISFSRNLRGRSMAYYKLLPQCGLPTTLFLTQVSPHTHDSSLNQPINHSIYFGHSCVEWFMLWIHWGLNFYSK